MFCISTTFVCQYLIHRHKVHSGYEQGEAGDYTLTAEHTQLAIKRSLLCLVVFKKRLDFKFLPWLLLVPQE